MAIKRYLTKLFFILGLFILPAALVLAVPPASEYEPGATLNPDCAPGSTNCTVDTLWNIDTVNDYVYNLTDKIGIGTSTPSADFQLFDGTLSLAYETVDTDGDPASFLIEMNDENLDGYGGVVPGISLSYDDGIDQAFVSVGDTSNIGGGTVGKNTAALGYHEIDNPSSHAFNQFIANEDQALVATFDDVAGDAMFFYFDPSTGFRMWSNYTTDIFEVAKSGQIFSKVLEGGSTTLSVDASGNIIRTPSDGNLKTDIKSLSHNIDRVMQLNPVSYSWKNTERFGEQSEIGFVAQELESVVPEAVRSGGEYKSVNYQILTALNAGAIKELAEQVRNGFISKIERIREIIADKIKSVLIETDELKVQDSFCLGDICITEAELREFLSEEKESSPSHREHVSEDGDEIKNEATSQGQDESLDNHNSVGGQ
jgi:hypothetical protein